MLKVIRPYLFSPALPAAMLLFGLVFCLAFFQFAGFRWQSSVTITLYGGLLVWMALLAWYQRKLWGGIGVIDVLFGTFVLAILVSLLMQGSPNSVAWKYGRYLPFLVIMPYMYGRLMRASSMQMFFKIVASAGGVMLLLLLIDYSQRLASLEVYSRWPFFGHDFAVLLIAMLLAASLIIGSFLFLTEIGKGFRYLLLPQVGWLIFLGLTSAALVAVAARGALLAGVIGTVLVVLAARKFPLLKRISLLLYLLVIMSFSYGLLPKPQTQVYTNLRTMPDILVSADTYSVQQRDTANPDWTPPNRTWSPITRNWDLVERTSNPGLGSDSCRAADRGINSLAIRWTLYQEAWTIFLRSPVWGVGAASFGRYSCAGEMGFPHSTILQSFAELGIVGGLLYCGLLITAFFSLLSIAIKKTSSSLAAQLTLSLLVMYLVADQLYGNYFMAAGSYLFFGVAAGMKSNPAWNDATTIEMPSTLPKISVITPSFNQAEYLERTLRSVLDQGYSNLEYIVIDGGSTDGSVDIIRRYADRLAYWVSEPDRGQADALNKGLRRATGEWIAWQNSDDIYFPGAFHGLAMAAARHPEAGLIIGDMMLIDAQDRPLRDIRYVKPNANALIAEGMVLANQASFWRRNVQERVGLLNEAFHCSFDYEWFLRLTEHTKAIHVNRIWGALRLHGETKTSLLASRFQEENQRILAGREMPIWKKRVYQLRRLALMLGQGQIGYVLRGLLRQARGQRGALY